MKQKIARTQPRIEAPQVSAALPEMTFASEHPDLPKPALEVKTKVRATFASQKRTEQAAPDIRSMPAEELAGQKLIALSETPAPPAPVVDVPVGNLTAQFVMSPEAKAASAPVPPNAPSAGAVPATGKRTESTHGGEIPGISITGPRRGPIANIAGPLGNGGGGLGLSAQPGRSDIPHQPGVAAVPQEVRRTPAPSIKERIKTAMKPEDLLDPGRIYTLHVSMPNLASVTGTWTLKFVELDENGKEIPGTLDSPEIAGPEPMRKVDPRYPPALMSARVQGDVVLYAIIRRDGSVDSIEVVRSLDPQLDQNAMEALARWKFRAAQREGRTVELATIVRIPFRAVEPTY
jgi:protein TonB